MTNVSPAKFLLAPMEISEMRVTRFYDDITNIKRLPWKYLYYHVFRDIVGLNFLSDVKSIRLNCVDSLHHGVFKSRKVDKKKFLGL